MDWIVFGDDWGGHPSTTQHLILNMPDDDKVIWIDSIGMRQPGINVADIKRVWKKAKGILSTSREENSLYASNLRGFSRIKPKVIPWHLNKVLSRFNSNSLSSSIRSAMNDLSISDPVLLSATPVVSLYLDQIPHKAVVYLRLDDYEHYPGCDQKLVKESEKMMFESCDVVVATAKSLLPNDALVKNSCYLPQGVQFEHFSGVSMGYPRKKILGFFGTLSEWVDFELIEQVAKKSKEWTLEFIGNVDYLPENIEKIPNIRILPAIPFNEIPDSISNWSAAWIPFKITELTEAVNPLKLREYLAAGLPTQCVPLPEVLSFSSHILISDTATEIIDWLEYTYTTDSREQRNERRVIVQEESWAARCDQLHKIIDGINLR